MDRPFACTECSQKFTRNENLERHKRSKHQEYGRNQQFECSRCPARFSRRDVCKRHAKSCRGQTKSRHAASINDQGDEQVPDIAEADDAMSFGTLSLMALPISPSGTSWSGPASSTTSKQFGVSSHIAAYFEHFHPSFPILHRPTFLNADDQRYPTALKSIVIAIGSLYNAQSLPDEEKASCLQTSQVLWNSTRGELEELSSFDCTSPSGIWIMQAWLLHVVYGAFMGDSDMYGKAKTMLRSLINTAQDLGLLRQAVAISGSQSWVRACNDDSIRNNEQLANEHWMSYVNEESAKLAMHALLFLDYHVLYPCNIRSITCPIDFDWELPYSSQLWDAENATVWLERASKEPRINALLEPDDSIGLPRLTINITMATHSLMSDCPSSLVAAALGASPIATLFVTTNLDLLIRDLTRSYYQLPPTLEDPSAFHIFTQFQNRLFNAALRNISSVVMEQESNWDGSEGPIWNTVKRMLLATRISLYKPDDLLIGGVVDSSIVGGLTTAIHLALGRYTESRRSLQSMLRQNSGDDAILIILEDAVDALHAVCSLPPEVALHEAPWDTIVTHRILLAIWRSLRWATNEMRARMADGRQAPRRFDTPTVIHNAIMEVIMQHGSRKDQNWDWNESAVTETKYTHTMLEFWKRRSVWAIGPNMVTVLNEILTSGL